MSPRCLALHQISDGVIVQCVDEFEHDGDHWYATHSWTAPTPSTQEIAA